MNPPFDGQTTPKVLVVASNWWPLSARLAIALIRHGCHVSALCPPGHPLRHVSQLKEIHTYRRVGSRRSLLAAIRQGRPHAVIPADDRCVAQLQELHSLYPELRPLIERSLGNPAAFEFTQSRGQLLDLAQQLGIRVPGTRVVESAEQAYESFFQHAPTAVLKLDGTYGGEGVQIVYSPAEAASAFSRMAASRGGFAVACKRMLVNHDPLALWARGRQPKLAITLQRFVNGTPANIMVACWQGKVLADASVEAVACQGATGAANVVRVISNAEMSRAAALLASRLGLSGFFGLDFILERSSGAAYLIEMNPRCTQLGHLPLSRYGDLAGVWFAAMTGRSRKESVSVIPDTIAFFPQAWRWGTPAGDLQHACHDVPWDERRLVEALMREPWPERQWIARLYHRFRTSKRKGTTGLGDTARFDSAPPVVVPLRARSLPD